MFATTDPQSSHLSNLQSNSHPNVQSSSQSNPQSSSQSIIHNGNNNQGNNGIIGDGSGHIVANSCQINNYQVTRTEGENELDELLYHAISEDALHDSLKSPPLCHPGTRKNVLNAITRWASNPAGSPLLWLHGPAGLGKSVIAKTVSTNSSDKMRVVATFFFSTSSDKSAATLFPTLAWQLAKNVPETRQYIVAALKGNRSLPKSELGKQFEQLIAQPLRKCTSTVTSGLVMVIDGVDECIDENMQRRFLYVLKGAGENGSLPLRFLICTRPEPRIRAILETADDDYATVTQAKSDTPLTVRPANPSQSGIPIDSAPKQSFSLRYQIWIKIEPYLSVAKAQLNVSLRWRLRHSTVLPSDASKLCRPMQLGVDSTYLSSEIPDEFDKLSSHRIISRIQIGLSEGSKNDVRIYLTDKFKEVCQFENDAIKPEDIEDLVKISCGHFLYASTIVRLLDDPSWNAKDVLDLARCSFLPTPDLDKLYSAILDNAREVMRREDGISAEADLAALRGVFGILVVLWEDIQIANISDSFPIAECLLVLEKGRLGRILRKMHSILDIIPGKSIRVYHRSFLEFLQHRCRSKHHYVAYLIALQRFLVLLSRFVLRYTFRRCCSRLQDDDKKQAECIRNMVLAFPRNFFSQSADPAKLATFHALIHSFAMLVLWTCSFLLSYNFREYLIASLVPSLCNFFVRFLFTVFLSFPAAFGSFFLSLVCYMSYVDRFIIFHPFLHPFFVMTIAFLLLDD